MKINKKMVIRILITLLCIVYSISTVAYAGFVNQFDGQITGDGEKGANAIVKIISSILGVVRTIGAAVALLIFMWVAVKYILASAGEKADLKKYLTTYVIGGLILFGASGILTIIRKVLDNSLG
jgi:hypothetical protein